MDASVNQMLPLHRGAAMAANCKAPHAVQGGCAAQNISAHLRVTVHSPLLSATRTLYTMQSLLSRLSISALTTCARSLPCGRASSAAAAAAAPGWLQPGDHGALLRPHSAATTGERALLLLLPLLATAGLPNMLPLAPSLLPQAPVKPPVLIALAAAAAAAIL